MSHNHSWFNVDNLLYHRRQSAEKSDPRFYLSLSELLKCDFYTNILAGMLINEARREHATIRILIYFGHQSVPNQEWAQDPVLWDAVSLHLWAALIIILFGRRSSLLAHVYQVHKGVCFFTACCQSAWLEHQTSCMNLETERKWGLQIHPLSFHQNLSVVLTEVLL